jgi:hypothetical protein
MADGVTKVLDLIKENDVKYVDFRFTDFRGKVHHVSQHVSTVDEDMLTDGVMFDGSSISGWKAINESDMILMPDADTAVMDPFAAQAQLNITCDILEPATGQPYSRDPRSIAKSAERYMASLGIGDTAYFGPEAEFFIFDDVRYQQNATSAFYYLDSEDASENTGKVYPDGNRGHRVQPKGGYFPVPPLDAAHDLRAEMLTTLAEMGVTVEKHHHEVAASQHELGIKFETLIKSADALQAFKYVVHNVADAYGKSATFMPKPVKGDNGSGMHVHQSIWKEGKPTFAGSGYAVLYRRHHQTRQGAERPDQPVDQQLQALDPGLRGAGAAGLFGPQPLGFLPHPLRLLAEGQARRGAVPGPDRQPLSRLLGHADGRPGRHPEQDPSGRGDGQEPVRPAAGGAEERPDGLRLAARGAAGARGRPRLPAEGRRVQQGHDRGLSRAEVGRGLRLRAHPAPDRVPDVLLGLIGPASTRKNPAGDGGVFSCANGGRERLAVARGTC